MDQRERDALARRHGERPDGVHVRAMKFGSRPEHEEVGTGHGGQRGPIEAADPRDAPPIVEPDHKIDVKLDPPLVTDHDPDEIGEAVARRHEVDQCGGTFAVAKVVSRMSVPSR